MTHSSIFLLLAIASCLPKSSASFVPAAGFAGPPVPIKRVEVYMDSPPLPTREAGTVEVSGCPVCGSPDDATLAHLVNVAALHGCEIVGNVQSQHLGVHNTRLTAACFVR
jgi:hypothetical protein